MDNKNLVIFDIDGTLTDTVCFDSDAFISIFMNYLNLKEINSNWDEYRYSTDSGFTLELFEKHINRPPSEIEIAELKQKFFAILEKIITDDPNSCRPIPGANHVFAKIKNLGNWDIAIATGCWLGSATMKLKYAALSYKDIPIACGDDHIERSEIIKIAIGRAKLQYQRNAYSKIIYVGDRMWDYHAAKKLNLNFIGVGNELANAKISAIPIINNYLSDSFFTHL